jgi:hypothetical protein
MTEEFELRTDTRAQLEMEILIPLLAVLSLAAVLLFAMTRFAPGPLSGHQIVIPWWVDVVALFVLLAIGAIWLQRPRSYVVSDDGIDVLLPLQRYRVQLSEIKEVVAVGERRARSLASALFAGTFQRIADGLQLLLRIAGGKQVIPLPKAQVNLTNCDVGGVKIVCTDGRTAILAPAELSSFLAAVEREFRRQNIQAPIVRESRVRLD